MKTDDLAELDTWLSFNDLQARGIVPNHPTLKSWQDDPAVRFPKGRLFGANSRRWALRAEIMPWLASRPRNTSTSGSVNARRRKRKRANG